MELTIDILKKLRDSGKNICIFSDSIINPLKKYTSNYFKDYSRTSYYYWLKKRDLSL